MTLRLGTSRGATPMRQRGTTSSTSHTRSSLYLLISLLVFLYLCSPAASASVGLGHQRRSAIDGPVVLDLPNQPTPPSSHTYLDSREPDLHHDTTRQNRYALHSRQEPNGDYEENGGEQTTDPPNSTTAPISRVVSTTTAPVSISSPTEDPQATTSRPSGTSTASSTPEPTDTAFPLPFDTSLSSRNMSSSGCFSFFQSYIHDKGFQDCFPISTVLITSAGFFNVMSSFVRLTRMLDSACSVSRSDCSSKLAALAEELAKDENCGADLRNRHTLVVNALNGFISYPHVRDVTCLKNPVTENYCFADAITNTTNPSDSNLYFLPVGISYPGGTRPTCNQCLQASMEIFSKVAEDVEQPLSLLYNSAADQINIGCGPGFVSTVHNSGSWSLYSPSHARSPWTRLVSVTQYGLLLALGVPLLSSMI